jgi:hypothetical protein
VVDARREGRAGSDQPASAPGRSRERAADPHADPQADSAGGADLGWTVFGPAEDEEPAAAPVVPEIEVSEPAPDVPPAAEPARVHLLLASEEPPEPSQAAPSAAPSAPHPDLVVEAAAVEPSAAADPAPEVAVELAPATVPEELRPPVQVFEVEHREQAPEARPPQSEVRRAPRSDPIPAPALGLPRPWVALVLAVPLLLLGGWLVSKLGAGSAQAKEPLAGAPSSAEEDAQVQRLERELAALRGELERARAQAAEASSLRGELEATRGEVAARIESLEQLLAQAPQAAPVEQAAAIQSASEPASQAATQQAAAAEAPKQQDTPARDATAREPASGRPQAAPANPEQLSELRAKGFDRALAALESGRAGDALGRLEGLIAQRVFTGLESDGSALLWSLCSAWKSLAASGGPASSPVPGPDSPALAESRAALERARGLRADFESAAASWLGTAGGPSIARERLERLDLALGALDKEIGWASVELEAQHAPDWERIRALGVPQDPAQALQHSTGFACAHAAELCERTADAYTVSCLWSGDVDLEGLAQAQHLAAWGQDALSRPAGERSESQTDLLWLWYAQRWFVQGERAEAFDWSGLAAPGEVAPSDDWRAELRLAIELAAAEFQWPGGLGARALYSVESAGPARWRVDETRRLEREGAGWHIDRSHFDAQGGSLGSRAEVRIERSGERFAYAGASGALLDLRASGARVSVEPCGLELPAQFPELEGLDLGQPGDAQALAEAVRQPCLVFQDGEWTRWFAPGLGLVREVRNSPEGSVRVELCALGTMP